jgi:hypothetical protein
MDNNELQEKIKLLEQELNETKEHLKKYTAPSNMKKYYENHKDEIKNKVKEYKNKTNYYENLSLDNRDQSILSWFFSNNVIADGFPDNAPQHILSWFFSKIDIADGILDN